MISSELQLTDVDLKNDTNDAKFFPVIGCVGTNGKFKRYTNYEQILSKYQNIQLFGNHIMDYDFIIPATITTGGWDAGTVKKLLPYILLVDKFNNVQVLNLKQGLNLKNILSPYAPTYSRYSALTIKGNNNVLCTIILDNTCTVVKILPYRITCDPGKVPYSYTYDSYKIFNEDTLSIIEPPDKKKYTWLIDINRERIILATQKPGYTYECDIFKKDGTKINDNKDGIFLNSLEHNKEMEYGIFTNEWVNEDTNEEEFIFLFPRKDSGFISYDIISDTGERYYGQVITDKDNEDYDDGILYIFGDKPRPNHDFDKFKDIRCRIVQDKKIVKLVNVVDAHTGEEIINSESEMTVSEALKKYAIPINKKEEP